MKIGLRKLGAFENAEIELAPLTILCGANNTGKTYAMYVIYGLLGARVGINPEEEDLLGIDLPGDGVTKVPLDEYFKKHWAGWHRRLSTRFKGSLPFFFSADPDFFQSAELSVSSSLEAALPFIKQMEIHDTLRAPNKSVLAEISKPKGTFELTITRGDKVPKSVVVRRISTLMMNLSLAPFRSNNAVWLLPAERAGLNLFYSELNRQRSALLHHASQPKVDAQKLIQDVFIARYPQPIADYIDLLNDMRTWKKQKSEFHEIAQRLQGVLQGKFALDREANITFTPKRTKKAMGLHMTSSIVKTYFGFWFYLEHIARKGDVLMIDEPELNLHPDNQRRLARLLAQLVRLGQRVIISTHSDYIIREFNNLLILGHDFEGKEALLKKYKYDIEDRLTSEQVRAYRFNDGGAEEMEMDPDEGIIAETFDKVINDLNVSSFELASAWASSKVGTKSNTEQ